MILFFLASVVKSDEDSKGNKIVGGQIAERNAIPHQAALLIKKLSGEVFLCGGLLINHEFIITKF